MYMYNRMVEDEEKKNFIKKHIQEKIIEKKI